MNRIKTLLGVALALLGGIGMLSASSAAHAQARTEDTAELSKDWNARIGLYVFQSKAARDVGGPVGISGILERRVYRGEAYDVNIGIGYNGWDVVYSVPVTVTIIGYQHKLRYGAGAGYAFNKRLSGSASNGAALELLLGAQLTQGKNPISVDLRYLFLSGSSNELDGYSLTFGMRF